jgi:Asp-tRNA(Asn)/Glu-tRNA(Gln) amidotransferase A subunit family amidase
MNPNATAGEFSQSTVHRDGSQHHLAAEPSVDRDGDFCAAAERQSERELALRQLAALEKNEAVVQAFVCCDPREAREVLDRGRDGPLGHALLGAKDIIATARFPTRYGSATTLDDGPRQDAWCVATARHRGSILLGKTVCTEFAIPLPGPTTNPWDPRRTPGGSSSGSAAAVAAGFVSFALGTQTAGSTIRPASYCGVAGYKPSFGLLPLEGVRPISTTLDHLGLFALSPRDAWYFTSALLSTDAEIVKARRPKRVIAFALPAEIPQRDLYPERMTRLLSTLREHGVTVQLIDLPFPVSDFAELQKELCYWEAARILLAPGDMHIAPELRALLAPWLGADIASYAAATRRRQRYQAQFEAIAAETDVFLMPAATGAAPMSLLDTGDAVMNRFWTALQVPAFSVPFWRSAEGMPLGLQLVSGLGRDRELAATAQWFFELGLVGGVTRSAPRAQAS